MNREGIHSPKLIQALREAGVVVIVISHRSSILHYADRILNLPSGQISSSKMENHDKSKLRLIESDPPN